MSDRSSIASRNIGACDTLLGGGNSIENVNTTLLDDGCFSYVTSEHKHYELHRDSTASPSPPNVIAPAAGGPGRWVPAAGGAQGAQGSQGSQGGAGGAQGAQGFQGAQGSQGFQGGGFQGAQGFQGATGSQGFQGAQGFLQLPNTSQVTNVSNVTGAQATLALNNLDARSLSVFYVNPSIPSDSTPVFKTIQSAINAAAGGNVEINLPPIVGITENLVFPATGAVTLICNEPSFGCTIIGNLTDTGGSGGVGRTLVNVSVVGNITFTNTGTFTFLRLFNSQVNGDISIGPETLQVFSLQPGNSRNANYTLSYAIDLNLTGNITCGAANLNAVGLSGANKTYTWVDGTLRDCVTSGTGQTFVGLTTLLDTTLRNAATFTGAVRSDDYSAEWILLKGSTVSGGLSLLNESVTKGPTAFAANVGATAITPAGVPPAGMYEIRVSDSCWHCGYGIIQRERHRWGGSLFAACVYVRCVDRRAREWRSNLPRGRHREHHLQHHRDHDAWGSGGDLRDQSEETRFAGDLR